MKINKTVLSIAIAYNIINFLFWKHIENMNDATSMIYLFILPLFWFISIIFLVILGLKNKLTWFNENYRISTIIILLFCTPIFFLTIRSFNSSDIYRDSTGFLSKNGYTIKYESWSYNNGSRKVTKYWKVPEINCYECDSTRFKKDSTWIYLNEKKDTIKVEVYKDGKLISRK